MSVYTIDSVGLGHTRSLQWSGQNSRILSYRYHWRSSGSPGGTTSSGSSTDDGVHDGSFLKIMVVSVPSTSFDTLTFPGKELEKWKCCIFLIPFKAVLVVCWSKYSPQLYVWTMGSPLCDPTNCAVLGVADLFTACTMSSRQPMLVLLYCCFISPKHQSGANFVCPTGRNDILIS